MIGDAASTSLEVELGGTRIGSGLAKCIASTVVRQTLNAPSLAEVVIAEPVKHALFGADLGAQLRLTTRTNAVPFDGEIAAVEHERDSAQGHVVRLRAFDKLNRLRKRQRLRALTGVSAVDLVREAAREIDVACTIVETSPARELVVQHEQSDFDLLIGLAAEAGLYLFLTDDTLRLFSIAGEGAPLAFKLGRDLVKVRTTLSADPARRSAAATAWDVSNMAVLSEAASSPRQGGAYVHWSESAGERLFFNRIAGSLADVRAFAQFDLDHAASRATVIEASAVGNPEIRPGRIVAVEGVDGTSLGQFTVTTALHRFGSDTGYTTEFTSAPPERRVRPPAPVFTIGIVTDVSDPQRWSRIKVKLPLFGNVESIWMPVLIAAAGPNKGLAIFPEPQDQVLIVVPDGNLASGIVLGGLYGEQASPGLVESSVRPFVLRTANGQSVVLDADKRLLRLETSGGDHLELGPNGTRLRASHDLFLEAPGKTITIRARAVEFEQG